MIIAHQKSISYVPTTNNYGFEAATCLDLPSVPGYDPASLLGWRLSYGYLAGKDKWPRLNAWGNVECGVSAKNVASESASEQIFGDLGVGFFCLFVVCFDLVQLIFTYFYHPTHHQAEPLLCGEGYDWYDLWPCKIDHKMRKVQRCSSFAFLGGKWSFFFSCVFPIWFPFLHPFLLIYSSTTLAFRSSEWKLQGSRHVKDVGGSVTP